jgi:hypothetical protein
LEIEELEKKNIFKNEVVSDNWIFDRAIFFSSWLIKPNQWVLKNKFHSLLQSWKARMIRHLNLKRKSRCLEEELNLLMLEKLQH